MKFYVNTDTVNIRAGQIGISFEGTVNREFCAGVNHSGTKKSVAKATEIAHLMASAPEMLEMLKELLGHGLGIDGVPLAVFLPLRRMQKLIEKAEGFNQ